MKKITQKWFSGDHPVNADYASVSIGVGDNGVVTVTATTLGTEENSYTIEVVEGVGSDVDLSATFEDGGIFTIYGTEYPVGKYDTDKWKTGTIATL